VEQEDHHQMKEEAIILKNANKEMMNETEQKTIKIKKRRKKMNYETYGWSWRTTAK
jgi:hypothetical protein